MRPNKCYGPAGALAALLLAGCGARPPEGAAPEAPGSQAPPKEPSAEVRASQEKLRRIGAAFLKGDPTYPAGFAAADRRPILSWRVALLPQLGHKALFQRFKRNEPWDGPNNRKLLAEMPDVYRPTRGPVQEGHTYYQVFVGEQALFPALGLPGRVEGPPGEVYDPMYASRTRAIDGTSYTFLVVEGGEPVPWTKPEDLPYDPARPVPRLGGQFDGDFNACFCDGSVHLIPRTIPEKMLRALITPHGGEDVDLSMIGLPDPRRRAAASPAPLPRTVTIRGKVRFKGEPLPGGRVALHVDTGMPNPPWVKFDDLKPDGSFTLKDVVTPGKYKVCVFTMQGLGKFVRIPEKYRHPGTTPLSLDLTTDLHTLDIDLTE